jgi:hypothetical protein
VAGKQAVGWSRLRNLVLGLPPAALAGTPAYARYQALLPQMLAQTVAPDSADYQWFMTFIAQWDECLAEYQDLQSAFADDE